MPPYRSDRGQALPLVTLVVLLAGLLAFGLARFGVEAVDAASAQTAADAAALAAVFDEDAAASVARENGGQVVSVHRRGRRVCVVVVRRGAEARACAAPDP